MTRAALPLLLVLAFLTTSLQAQTPTVLTVGSGSYPTIQSAATAGCAPGATGPVQILIPGGAAPADTVARTRGCQKAYIVDQRVSPAVTCQWNAPAYLCTAGPQPPPTPATNSNLLPALADYRFLDGKGSTLADASGNSNNATLGTTAPTWEALDLAFDAGQFVTLPASLNSAQTIIAAVYLSPIQGGPLGYMSNLTVPVLVGNTANDAGLSLLLAAPRPTGGDYIRYGYAPSVFSAGNESTATAELIAGFHVFSYALGTNGTSVDHLYIDGVEYAYGLAQGSNTGKQTTGTLTLGAAPGTPSWRNTFKGTFFRFRAYSTQLSAAQVSSESAGIRAEVAARGVAVTPTPVLSSASTLHCVGDSITYGVLTTAPYCSNLTLDAPFTSVQNWGIPGMYLQSIAGSELNRVARWCAGASAGPNAVSVFAATNDFAETPSTAARIFGAAAAEVATLKRAGCQVYLGTMISRSGSDPNGNTLDADKNTYDALLLARAKSIGADGVIDFAADPRLGADGAYSNSTYFNPDLTHPTNAGQAILAAEMSNALNYYQGASVINPKIVTAASYSMGSGDAAVLLKPTAAQALTLPSCLGPTGAEYRFLNNQSTYSVTVAGLTAAQTVNGSTSALTLPGSATTTLRIVANPKATGGCQWIADGSGGSSTPAAATPSISPAGGTYSSAQTITLADATSGAAMFYTTDGSTPSSSSTAYSAPFTLSSGATVQAIATKSGLANSPVASATYVINTVPATYASNGCASAGGSSAASLACTTSGVTAGQTLLVNVVNYAAGTTTLTDSSGNAATILSGYPASFGGGSNAVYVIKNASAGTHTITATFSAAGSYPQLQVDAISGASATSPIDAASSLVQATTGGVYDYSCPAVTTNSANELVISFINTTGGQATGFESTPQQLTQAQASAPTSNLSAYGTFTTAGSNFVRWQVAGGSFSCDTVALH